MSPELFQTLTSSSFSVLSAFAHSLGLDFSDLTHMDHFGHFDHMSLSADVHTDAGSTHGEPVAEAPQAPVEYKEIHELGHDPVARAGNGKTAIENGFTDTTDNGIDDSPIEKSAAEVAKRLGMTPEQTKDFLKQVHDHKQEFIEASRVTGYNKDGVKDVLIQKGEAVMGNGSGTAQDVRLNLTHPEQGVQTVITLSDGTKVDFTVADKCANPILSLHQDEAVPPAPVMKCDDAGTTISRDPNTGPKLTHPDGSSITGNERNLVIREGEEIPVVTIKDMNPDGFWQDYNHDGNAVTPDGHSPVGKSWDTGTAPDGTTQQEIFPGITQSRLNDDVQYFTEKYHHVPKFIVYDVTDCNGRNMVACYDVKTHQWGFFYPNTTEGIPVDTHGDPVYQKDLRGDYKRVGDRVPAIIDSHNELEVYLGKQQGKIS